MSSSSLSTSSSSHSSSTSQEMTKKWTKKEIYNALKAGILNAFEKKYIVFFFKFLFKLKIYSFFFFKIHVRLTVP